MLKRSQNSLKKSQKPLNRGNSKLNSTSKLKREGNTLQAGKGLKKRQKTEQEKIQQKESIEKMWSVMLRVWEQRGPYSEVSKQFLGYECKTVYMHHCIPKSRYPQAKYDPECLIILSWEEHAQEESSPGYYEEVRKRTQMLKEKYKL